MEQREFTGQFWTPDSPPEKGVGGIFSFNRRDGVRLKLLDRLKTTPAGAGLDEPDDEVEVILGVTHQGKELTLVRSTLLDTTLMSAPWIVPHATYRADTAYIGGHLAGPADRAFTRATLTIDGFDYWTLGNNFDVSWPRNATADSSATWRHPGNHVADCDGARVILDSSLRTSHDHRGVTMMERARLTVEPAKPLPLEELRGRFVYPLQNLATLMVGTPAFLERFFVQSPAASDPNRPGHPIPVEVLYSPLNDEGPSKEWTEPFLHLKDCQRGFGSIISTWIRIADDGHLGPVLNGFFGTQYRTPGFVELRFLTLASALESYHTRRFVNAMAEPAIRFEQRVEVILEVVGSEPRLSSKDRHWLKGKLATANDPPLEQRYRELIDVCGPFLPIKLADPRSAGKLLARTRNHLAHGSSRSTSGLAGLDRFWGEQFLRILLSTLLFRELDIPAETVKAAWDRSGFYRWAMAGIGSVSWTDPPP